jgi:hypothetical protein
LEGGQNPGFVHRTTTDLPSVHVDEAGRDFARKARTAAMAARAESMRYGGAGEKLAWEWEFIDDAEQAKKVRV